MQTYETILATNQEFFFTKVAFVQSITDIMLLGFWFILLPECLFLLHYHLFFRKNFFFRMMIFQWTRYWNVICFLVEAIHYVRTQLGKWRGGSVIQNVYRCVQGERDILPSVHVRTYTISFHVFVLWCLVLFTEI